VINLALEQLSRVDDAQGAAQGGAGRGERYGAGAGAVRTIAGTMKLHMELEEQIAAFKTYEACVGVSVRIHSQRGTVFGGPW